LILFLKTFNMVVISFIHEEYMEMTAVAKLGYKESGIINVGSGHENCVGLFSVAVNPKTAMVYIANVHSPNLAVVDGNTDEFIKTIKLTDKEYHFFSEICFNPVNERLYVTTNYLNKVWSVDTAKEVVVGEYEPGKHPAGLASDSKTGKTYVALGGDSAVAVFDSDDNLLKKIPVKPWPYPVAIDPENNRCYVVSQMANMAQYQNFANPIDYPMGILNIIDTEKGEVIGEVEVERRSRGVAVNPKTGLVYVAHRVDDSILVIDPEKKKVVKRLKTKCNPFGMCMYPEKDKLYTVNMLGEWYDNIGNEAMVTVVDTKKDEIVKHFKVGKISAHIAVNPLNGRAYVPNEDDMNLSVIDTDKDEEIGRVHGFGLTMDGMEVNSKTNRLYIPAHFIESVRTVDTKNLEVVGDINFGSWGTDCAINEKLNHIYFNNSEEGMVHVIDGKTNREISWANLGVGSNLMHRLWACIACDDRRNRVFAALVRQNGVAMLEDDHKNDRLLLQGRVTFGNPHSQDPGQFPGAIHMGVTVNRETGMVYVYNTFHRTVNKVDPESMEHTGQTDLSGIRLPMADLGTPGYMRKYAPLYVIATDEKRNLVYANNVVIDGETMRVREVLPIEKVTGVHVVDNEKNRLFAHGIRGMTIMDPETYEELLFIPHGCPDAPDSELRVFWGVDSSNDRLYLQRQIFMKGNEIQVFDLK